MAPENPPFRHHYANPSLNLNLTPPTNPMPPPQGPQIPVRCCVANSPQGHIEELPKEPPEQPPSDPGDDDGRDDDDEPEPCPNAADPIPNPDLNSEADSEAQVSWLLMTLERLADNTADVGIATCLVHRKSDPRNSLE
jgi:hypothetical protein